MTISHVRKLVRQNQVNLLLNNNAFIMQEFYFLFYIYFIFYFSGSSVMRTDITDNRWLKCTPVSPWHCTPDVHGDLCIYGIAIVHLCVYVCARGGVTDMAFTSNLMSQKAPNSLQSEKKGSLGETRNFSCIWTKVFAQSRWIRLKWKWCRICGGSRNRALLVWSMKQPAFSETHTHTHPCTFTHRLT